MAFMDKIEMPPPLPTLADVDVAADPLFGGLVTPAPPGPAEELFRRCVDAAQKLHRRGDPIRAELISHLDRKVPKDQAELVLRSKRFRASLSELGIETEQGVTAEQQAFLVAYFSPEMWQRELTTILRATNVSNVQFQGWLKQPSFALEFEQWQDDIFRSTKAAAITSFNAAVEQGKAWAVKIAFAKSHFYDPQGQAAEMHQLLSALLGILDDELRGDQFAGVMRRIGDRVRAAMPDLAMGLSERQAPTTPTLELTPTPERPIPPLSDFDDEDGPQAPAVVSGLGASLSGEWHVDLSKPVRTPPTD